VEDLAAAGVLTAEQAAALIADAQAAIGDLGQLRPGKDLGDIESVDVA